MIKQVVLGSLISLMIPMAASAQVVDALQVDGFGLALKYPAIHTEKSTVDNVINKDIRFTVNEAKAKYENNQYDTVLMDYVTSFENTRYVSGIIESTYQDPKLAHPITGAQGFIFDKTNGQRPDVKKLATIPTVDALTKGLASGTYKVQALNGSKFTYDASFKPEKVSQEYFLTKDGQVAALYQPGDLGPNAIGLTYVVLPTKSLKK